MRDPLTFVDVFAGGGGLSEGFIQAGYDPIAHVEADQAACYTLRTRMAYHWLVSAGHGEVYADYLEGGIGREELYAEVPQAVVSSVINREIRQDTLESIYREIDSRLRGRKLDLLVGGPPCQAYSVVGRSRDPNGMLEDKRNYLYRCYAKFLDKYRPQRFVFENVKGLLSAKDGNGRSYLDDMQSLFRNLGYETAFSTLCAREYGILQNRKRVVLVGSRGDIAQPFPHPAQWKPDVTVREVFADLPAIHAGGGGVIPCQRKPHESSWQVDAGVRSALPLTWHQARPHADRDLEIYRIAVRLWNERKMRLKYGSLPGRLKTHRSRASFTKGKHGFDEVLDYLWGIYHTGLTRIMGGRGLLEERLDRVFKTNLLPLLDVWITYGAADAKRTERALLRFALGHLVADLEGDETPCYPEEVYLAPPLEDALTTGTVVRGKDDRARHVVMTPACDLVIRDGKTKAKSVVLVEIVSEGDVFGSLKGKARDRRRREERLRSNSADYCYHWLPKSRHVDGGFLDFRRLHTIPMDRLNDEFEHPSVHVQIAPSFIKDIVSRFAAFYARQGQPVIRSATTDP